MNHEQINDLLKLLAHCGAGGILWLIAHGVSMAARTNRRMVRFVVMSGFAFAWIFFLWPLTGRGHREFLPLVFSIVPWWAAIIVGNLVERKKEKTG